MKTESLTVQEAMERGQDLPWVWVRCLSQVALGPALSDIDREELIEARFFSTEEEIRIFRSCGQLCSVRLCGEPEDNTLERTYQIANKQKFGETITVCYTLEADEDGQVSLGTARLTGWEGSA